MAAPERRRLFFALWPDQAVSTRLAAAARAAHALCGGRVMRRDSLHLTLVFVGAVTEPLVDKLHRAASLVSAEAFSLSFDRYGCWQRKGIVWAGCAASPPLSDLVGQLAGRLVDVGLRLERREFAAHLTLLRNARCVDLAQFSAIDWPVAEFVLVESQLAASAGGYTIIGRWPLAQPPSWQTRVS
ncbi:2'-5'-RNA ligase [mine drainage metagenome]|uniref:2'-5'-RNA ligase n=1 Tax=mine drainage metagenome TaxID=410659 RepID=A0A1J5RIZ2_9ZZZZ